MQTRNQNQQQQQPSKAPASASSKASGGQSFEQLQTEAATGFHIVGRYRTASGAVGMEVRVSAKTGRLSYTGKWGAGSGLTRESLVASMRVILRHRRGVVAEIPYAGIGGAL